MEYSQVLVFRNNSIKALCSSNIAELGLYVIEEPSSVEGREERL